MSINYRENGVKIDGNVYVKIKIFPDLNKKIVFESLAFSRKFRLLEHDDQYQCVAKSSYYNIKYSIRVREYDFRI